MEKKEEKKLLQEGLRKMGKGIKLLSSVNPYKIFQNVISLNVKKFSILVQNFPIFKVDIQN